MRTFCMVHTDFWQDPKVGEELSPEDKYFFLYLLTNPSTTQIGIYQITRRQMAFDLGYSIETVNNLLERFMHHLDMVRYNPETRELAIKSWGRYNLKRAGKPMMDCVCNELEKVKDKTLIAYVGERIHHETFKELFLSWGDEKEAAQEEWKLEVEEEGEQPEKDEIQKLFDHFVSKKIILHKKMNQAMKRAIKLSLKDYTYEELKHAIDNYATVYFSDAHWFTHKYALADFMRDKDIRKFLDEADPIQNFANKQNPQIKKPKEIRKEDFDLS